MRMNKYMRVAAVFALAACLGVLGACGKKEQQQEGAALPVSAVKVLKTDLPSLRALGSSGWVAV